MMHYKKKPAGVTLLELIVAIALFMIFAAGMTGAAIGSHLTNLENAKATKANAFIVESWEAVKSIRNVDWEEFENGTHGLSQWGDRWSFSGSSDEYDGFTRVVTVEEVLRDEDGNIVLSGADVDPDTKKISIDLSWEPSDGQSRSFYTESYLTNYLDPAEWPEPAPEPPPEP